ncbi:unnamed protein product [Aphanomyces euteiches]
MVKASTFLVAACVVRDASFIGGLPRSEWETKTQKVLDFVAAQHALSKSPGWALAVVHHNKTLITQGFGLNEVDDGRVAWRDPVKKHLPWFQLKDKKATVNCRWPEREWVERLEHFATKRQGYEYTNVNFVILGQVIQEATNKTWGDYLTETIWRPLGMNHTFPKPTDAPVDMQAFGHYVGGGKVVGPFNPHTYKYTALMSFDLAAGSIISSILDMAIFAKFLLSKGQP